MSKGRLTRHELSWLLTQEAQNAAERLRVGVQFLRTQAPPPPATVVTEDPSQGVETSLDALDDVMKMLSNLNSRQPAAPGLPPGRRGRIDLAAVIVEVAPSARVAFEPGSGTEVYGDETELRRMVQVLVGHGSGEGATVSVKREGDEVKVAVSLGPDSSATAETERAWLSRVALRYGGRHELEGGNEVLVFPADGASDRNESVALRKELDEARKQGEVYARELAAVFERGEEVTSTSTVPPALSEPSEVRLTAMTKVCSGIASELRSALGSASRELATTKAHEVTEEQLDALRRRLAHTTEVVTALGAIGELRADELETEIDLGEVVQATARALAPSGEREGVKLSFTPPASRVHVRRGAKAVGVLVRELVAHALDASPRGSSVDVAVLADDGGARLVVDDAGAALPASGRRGFLALETHAGAYGRPSGLPIFLAAELAACQGATLELSDPPQSGLRVTVTFAER